MNAQTSVGLLTVMWYSKHADNRKAFISYNMAKGRWHLVVTESTMDIFICRQNDAVSPKVSAELWNHGVPGQVWWLKNQTWELCLNFSVS